MRYEWRKKKPEWIRGEMRSMSGSSGEVAYWLESLSGSRKVEMRSSLSGSMKVAMRSSLSGSRRGEMRSSQRLQER